VKIKCDGIKTSHYFYGDNTVGGKMPAKMKNPKQILIDGEIYKEFEVTCTSLERNPKYTLRKLLQDFNAKHRMQMLNNVKGLIPEVGHDYDQPDGVAMLSAIEFHMIESESKLLGDLLGELRNNYSLDRTEAKRIRKILGVFGVGTGRFGQVYISMKNENLARITGSVNYARYIRRECKEYRETKTCSVNGVPRRCLVMDFGEVAE
jgi:hypothetical protein